MRCWRQGCGWEAGREFHQPGREEVAVHERKDSEEGKGLEAQTPAPFVSQLSIPVNSSPPEEEITW